MNKKIYASQEYVDSHIVQSDFSQNDPAAADYVKNRTHYEETVVVNEPLNITWDGNTEGLVSAVDKASGGVPSDHYKISDAILTDEQIKTITETDDSGYSQAVSDFWDEFLSDGLVTPEVVYALSCYYVRKAGAEFGHTVFPEPGIYAHSIPGIVYVASITTTEPVEQAKTVVKKLDKKFLPDDIIPRKVKQYNITQAWDVSGKKTYHCYLAFADAYAMGEEALKKSITYMSDPPLIVKIGNSTDIGEYIILRCTSLRPNADLTISETVYDIIWQESGFTVFSKYIKEN